MLDFTPDPNFRKVADFDELAKKYGVCDVTLDHFPRGFQVLRFMPPPRAVRHDLLSAHAYRVWMLIGACDPLLCRVPCAVCCCAVVLCAVVLL